MAQPNSNRHSNCSSESEEPLISPYSNRYRPHIPSPSQFVITIHDSFQIDVPVCVFNVPDSLKDSNPKAYSPQVVGLGLLHVHHQQSKLALMQTHKIDVAKNIHKGFGKIGFLDLIDNLIELIPSVRACYPIHSPGKEDEVACILAIDGLFLFELLLYYGIGKDALAKSDILRGLVDTAGARLGQDEILRDTMMLENQIPFIVLKNILLIECSEPNSTNVASKKKNKSTNVASKKKNKSLIIDSSEPNSSHAASKKKDKSPIIECSEPNASNVASKKKKNWSRSFVEKHLPLMLCGYCKALSPLQLDYAQRAVTNIWGNVAGIVSALDIPNEIKPPIELPKGLVELPWSELDLSSIRYIVHVEKEIMIPTASKLSNVGVKFLTDHITAIGFDPDTITFKLPKIKLDVNSEVIIRNLVAYELLSKSESESLVFTRYFELMNGIIQTTKDVKVLRDHGILQSESMEDEEVVEIFSGTSKPLRLANAEDIDNAIVEVNKYYNGFRRVKARKFVKKCVFTLWNGRTLFAAILLLSLTALQAFCSVYGCYRLFNKTN
ncbi:putative UPF0481 protein At3g02645 [Castanea sativa]|uniref:putative UPF0481 protein At3g02645 n=1 Tax=Castanea sativa TaxID=21020 RepID=UPI003F651AA3